MRAALMMAVGFSALFGVAEAETYSVRGVDIVHAAAVVSVIPEDRTDISVETAPSAHFEGPSVRVVGDRVVIDGGLARRLRGCGGMFVGGGQAPVRIAGIGAVPVDELARITIRMPRTLDFSAEGGLYTSIGVSNGGRVSFGGCGDLAMVDANGALDVSQDGSGAVHVGAVSGALRASLDGSGSLDVLSAGGAADLSLDGSGDLSVGDVGGMLTAVLSGSGGLRAGNGAQQAGLRLNGSGDMDIGAVRNGLRATLDGSGAITVREISGGRVELAIDGSGDLDVEGGHVERLEARTGGSGSVRFNGSAEVLNATLGGSGDIRVRRAERVEALRDNGSGSVRIGN